MKHRLVAAAVACAILGLLVAERRSVRPSLASWENVGGCGAGASTGTGAGIKWIGRNVTGGLFRLECQGNYVHTPYGYNFIATALVSRDLTEKWNLGVSVPYLYKQMDDPYQLGFDVSNKGLGDINLLVTRRLGAINDTSVTISLGAPTGVHRATLAQDMTVILPQDRQLGLGTVTASIIVDHTIDNIWGPTVLGGLASWRGGENDLKSYRAPSATAYAYSSYLWGPLAPAIGLQVTGFAGHDRDRGTAQQSALFNVAPSISLEWATDWVALLLGASIPYQYAGAAATPPAPPSSPWGWGPWIVALGAAFTLF
jgi:hypothetical protein